MIITEIEGKRRDLVAIVDFLAELGARWLELRAEHTRTTPEPPCPEQQSTAGIPADEPQAGVQAQ